MKRGFTIVEVSILFIIFLIVAFLVAPLSLDDTMQEKNTSHWRNVQMEFANIFNSVNLQKEQPNFNIENALKEIMQEQTKSPISSYKITFMNGTYPNYTYRFTDYYLTQNGFVLSYKFFQNPQNNLIGMVMYDVNGEIGPNVWGKDVYGLNIYSDRFEPFCKNDPISIQKQDCAKSGTGLCCSNYRLVEVNFNQ